MMDLLITNIVTMISSGGLVGLMTYKSAKKEAEANAMAKIQGVYQTLVADLQADRADLKRVIAELKPRIADLEKKTEKNERMLRAAKPFLCAKAAGHCPDWKDIDMTKLLPYEK